MEGSSEAASDAPKRLFVIQKHAASHLHYDFRLEMAGVLKSWAVPKGIPFEQGQKHLAVHVEDHPLDYAYFEGTIPKGSYGGGTVMVWDSGEYTVSGPDPLEAYKTGKLHLHLKGKKLSGEWTLVRTRRAEGNKENWLLMKTGESVRAVGREKDNESALSGKTMQQIAASSDFSRNSTEPSTNQTAASTVRKADRLRFVEPMKTKLVKALPTAAGWIFEVKFDGYRAIAIKEDAKISLYSRNHKVLQFPDLAAALVRLQCKSGIFDGEIVALDEKGRPSFQLLQSREMENAPSAVAPICYYLFDLLNLDGADLCKRPLSERRNALKALLPNDGSPLRYSGALPGEPAQILAEIKARGLEGVVAKRIDTAYEPGQRSGAWIKLKCINEQEFVIGGYTPPKGARSHFGALLVGYYAHAKLHFAGKVGTGFSERLLNELIRDFKTLETAVCPFVDLPSRNASTEGLSMAELKKCHWIKPERVCQVKFTEWTRDGKLRQPVFLGLRKDKSPHQVIREEA